MTSDLLVTRLEQAIADATEMTRNPAMGVRLSVADARALADRIEADARLVEAADKRAEFWMEATDLGKARITELEDAAGDVLAALAIPQGHLALADASDCLAAVLGDQPQEHDWVDVSDHVYRGRQP